jgi:SP family sugar:H+ symporter-like MFS transporter
MYQNTTPVKSLEYRRRLVAEGPIHPEKIELKDVHVLSDEKA